MIRMCCVCKKVEFEGCWKTVSASQLQVLSHVYWPPCYEDLMDEIDRYVSQESYKSIYTIVLAGQHQDS